MGSYSLISDPVEVLIYSYPESGILVHLVGTSQATPSNYLQGLTLSTARLVLTSGCLIYYTFIALNNFKILILTSHLVHQPLGFRSVTLNIWGRWSRGQNNQQLEFHSILTFSTNQWSLSDSSLKYLYTMLIF